MQSNRFIRLCRTPVLTTILFIFSMGMGCYGQDDLARNGNARRIAVITTAGDWITGDLLSVRCNALLVEPVFVNGEPCTFWTESAPSPEMNNPLWNIHWIEKDLVIAVPWSSLRSVELTGTTAIGSSMALGTLGGLLIGGLIGSASESGGSGGLIDLSGIATAGGALIGAGAGLVIGLVTGIVLHKSDQEFRQFDEETRATLKKFSLYPDSEPAGFSIIE